MRMLVTRPEPDAEETAAHLRALEIEPVLCPLLTYETLGTSLPEVEGFAALALTSANAIRALSDRGVLQRYLTLPAYTVGDRTAEEARRRGFTRVESAGGSLGDLVELLAHKGLTGPVFYPAAREQSGDLSKSLAPYGVMVITTQIYAMNAIEALPAPILADLGSGAIAAALFYSRRTAAIFAALSKEKLQRPVYSRLGMLCLSETVAEPLLSAHFVRVGLADYPSEEAMMGLALSFARDQNAS